ncbi:MAG: hypothetical protein AAFN70_14340 [Planctomycetota bacterium]
MSFEVLLKTLGPACLSAVNIRRLIHDELDSLLVRLARTEYRAAIRALREARISRFPENEIQSARTHLRSAYETFHDLGTSESWQAKMRQELTLFFTASSTPRESAAEGMVEASAILATLYSDDRNFALRDHWIAQTRNAFEIWSERFRQRMRHVENFRQGRVFADERRKSVEKIIEAYKFGLEEVLVKME